MRGKVMHVMVGVPIDPPPFRIFAAMLEALPIDVSHTPPLPMGRAVRLELRRERDLVPILVEHVAIRLPLFLVHLGLPSPHSPVVRADV